MIKEGPKVFYFDLDIQLKIAQKNPLYSFFSRRYGIRTNSIMLLGLCLGWIFGILSFQEGDDVLFQLSFGLINGLQVSRLFIVRIVSK